MNRAGTLSVKDNTFGCGHYKKPKKKRHRNKLRNSVLRKNRQKKFYSKKKTISNKLTPFELNSESVKIMSNWYWSNYKKAMEWQERHKLAHWKACALALMEENRCLLGIINNMQPRMAPEVSVAQSNSGEEIKSFKTEEVNPYENFVSVHPDGVSVHNDDEAGEEEGVRDGYDNLEDSNDDDDDDDDIEFEMSEEMIQFFEQSYKHKMDLKKLREKELLSKAEEEIKQMQHNKIKRSTEMNLLYGEGASMIIGMETAVQLSFDKYCDTKSPKYWPNIPFRL